ncbi:hypothetical protein [Lacinutrix sp.]|uniref:hypothetical protein n=1 Tax=Lacinutrix sp. TaxID=1937692 RepID=UPI0026349E8E|nr:hypothetical protein [Lacinutrix sp.]MDG1714134.1 hypothetical protein [Lacinutrix sp.]
MNTNIKLIAVLFLTVFSMQAQQRLNKAVQSVKVNKEVTVELNTSHSNIEVDTWNKDYVEVEAYIESRKLTKEELKTYLKKWKVELNGSGNRVTINSKGSSGLWDSEMNSELFENESLEALSNINLDLDLNLKPLLEGLKSLESLKDLPEALKALRIPESPDGNYNLDFDFDKYQKEGEKYLDVWSKKYKKEYGAEYEQEMREWAKSIKQSDIDKLEKDLGVWGEQFGKDLEKAFEDGFGKDFEDKMEKWGEEFGKKFEKEFAPAIEKWGEEFGKAFEAKMEDAFGDKTSSNKKVIKDKDLIKTIKIKMPKKAKLKLNVRHGELKMASILQNVKADISHGSLLAQTIDGSSTSINVAYSSVFIKEWKSGELNLKYVEDAMIQHVDQLMLNSVSSTIGLDYIKGNTIIDGSFGELTIHNILPTFNNLNIVLENSDAMLKLPKNVDYKLFFKGNRSQFNNKTVSNKKIDNFPNSTSSNNTIVINAKYSNVIAE